MGLVSKWSRIVLRCRELHITLTKIHHLIPSSPKDHKAKLLAACLSLFHGMITRWTSGDHCQLCSATKNLSNSRLLALTNFLYDISAAECYSLLDPKVGMVIIIILWTWLTDCTKIACTGQFSRIGPWNKFVVFRHEGRGFESPHRRSTYPLGSPLLASPPTWKWCALLFN